MSIQISVTIWTIICFLLLMFILHNWLFKPVLEIMEKRRSRVENARKKQDEIRRLTDLHEEILIEERRILEKEQQTMTNAQLEEILAKSKKAVESAKASRLHTYEACREECFKEYTKIISSAEDSTKQIAEMFTDRLISQPRIK